MSHEGLDWPQDEASTAITEGLARPRGDAHAFPLESRRPPKRTFLARSEGEVARKTELGWIRHRLKVGHEDRIGIGKRGEPNCA